jgi:predicted nucleic acid-binding protein
MTLVDTSAWVEYLRGGEGPTRTHVRELISTKALATTEAVVMEILAGARTAAEAQNLSALLALAVVLPVGGLESWEDAAAVYVSCRQTGFTPRSQIDCLIAAVAIREEIPVLHADRDFDVIAQHTPLRVVAAD